MTALDSHLRELGSIPGVSGVFVVDLDGRLLGAAPRPLIESGRAEHAARIVAETTAALAALHDGVRHTLDLVFSDTYLAIKPIAQAAVCLICAPQANPSLLNLRTAVALRALDQAVSLALSSQAAAAARPKPAARLATIVQSALGSQAPKALALLAKAGDREPALRQACAEVVRFTRLFVGRAESEALERRLNAAFD
jgi:predicted regulator of Ras-like GTPase activity (Roadblock/LC7/MglB family)